MMSAAFLSPEIIWNGTLFNEGLWIYGLALGLFGMIIPVFLFTIAVPKVGLGMTSILSAIELPIAVTVSVILLSETVSTIQIAGIVIILLGISLPTMLTGKLLLLMKNKIAKQKAKNKSYMTGELKKHIS
jgi:drug/metabolite transporter (DMT)-like permease